MEIIYIYFLVHLLLKTLLLNSCHLTTFVGEGASFFQYEEIPQEK